MTRPDLDQLDAALTAACDAWVASGGRIAPLSDGIVQPDCRCPFGALVGKDNYPLAGEVVPLVGITKRECWQFMAGFDSGVGCDTDPFRALGRKYREKYAGGAS